MTALVPPPIPSRSSSSGDLEPYLVVPRRLKLSVLAGLLTFLGGAIVAHVTLAAKTDAAHQAAQEAPSRVLEMVTPRLDTLERDRDSATIERRSAARDLSAVRLYLCRECERARRSAATCSDICGRPL